MSADYHDMQKEVSEYARRYVDKVDLKEQVSVHTLHASGWNLSRCDSNKMQVLQPVRAKLYSSLERSPERSATAPYNVRGRKLGTSQGVREKDKRGNKTKPFFSRRCQKSRPKINVKAVIDSTGFESMINKNSQDPIMTQERLNSTREQQSNPGSAER